MGFSGGQGVVAVKFKGVLDIERVKVGGVGLGFRRLCGSREFRSLWVFSLGERRGPHNRLTQ